MNFLMYFACFVSVLVFFASSVAVTLWVLTKFIAAWGRFFEALIFPREIPKRPANVAIDLHVKRAGQ
jgi:hypothetical protein